MPVVTSGQGPQGPPPLGKGWPLPVPTLAQPECPMAHPPASSLCYSSGGLFSNQGACVNTEPPLTLRALFTLSEDEGLRGHPAGLCPWSKVGATPAPSGASSQLLLHNCLVLSVVKTALREHTTGDLGCLCFDLKLSSWALLSIWSLGSGGRSYAQSVP